MDWTLECSACKETRGPEGLPTVCGSCGAPYLVRYRRRWPAELRRDLAGRDRSMWRWREFLPISGAEQPVSLGEGGTPLLPAPRLGRVIGLPGLLIKDEAVNPTGSFKARGLSAAITRASLGGVRRFVLPTAGNAGVAAAAYGARAGAAVRVYAPASTPQPLLAQIQAYGAELVRVDGHIGDCGKLSREHAADAGAFDLSTLREPYRIEGKKTLGLELAEQLGWTLPSAVIYPTGGGTGLIGMWKAFSELIHSGWVSDPMPRLFSVQAEGCAPVVKAWAAGAAKCDTWPNPVTVASGLRVPGPLGGAVMLRAIGESKGAAIAVSDSDLLLEANRMSSLEGVDACPEGGAAVCAARDLRARGDLAPDDRVVLFNTGAGVLYGRDLK